MSASEGERASKPFAWSIGWIALVFITTRCMLLMWFRPLYSEFTSYHFSLIAQCERGYYPFFHYWMEYPPLFPWISVGLYYLAQWEFLPGMELIQRHALLAGILTTICETGTLVLIYKTGVLLHDRETAERAAWFYTALFFPLFGIASFFDSLPLFFLLLAVYSMLTQREYQAAVAIACGTVAKLIPIVLLPLLWKCCRRRLVTFLLVALLVAISIVPFVCIDTTWIGVFAQVTVQRSGWETVWAFVDGHYQFGHLGPLPSHAPDDPRQARASLLQARLQSRFSSDISFLRQPSTSFRIVYSLAGLAFIAVMLYSWLRLPDLPLASVTFSFAAFTLVAFFIYAKGWSPQFILYLLPFLILGLPHRPGLVIALSVVNFCEMPLWLFYFRSTSPLVTIVLIRTVLLLYLGLLFRQQLRKSLWLK